MFLTQIDPAFLAGEGGGTPSLDLFFSATKALDSRITFVRASVGTYIDENGALQTASSGVARFTHNPSTLASLGLLIEEARTNILLNSATLSTQSVTTTATAYTLSFTGTGTITLSGTSTAGPLVGTGTGESNRVALTFTPTAGTLTLTVSGTVTNAQLETGQFRTSYIPTTGSQATRAADVATMTGTNFSSWYRQDEGTMVSDYQFSRIVGGSEFPRLFTIQDSTFNDFVRIFAYRASDSQHSASAVLNKAGVTYGNVAVAGGGSNTAPAKAGLSFTSAVLKVAQNGSLATDSSIGVTPSVDRLYIGSNSLGTNLNGTISRLRFYRLPNASLQALTT